MPANGTTRGRVFRGHGSNEMDFTRGSMETRPSSKPTIGSRF
jgi:hypothetical protein